MNQVDQADEKHIAALTTRETLLLGLCLGAGIMGGVLLFLSKVRDEPHEWGTGFLEQPTGPISPGSPHLLSPGSAIWQWIPSACIGSLLLLGPGTWFGVFGRFGKRGAERRKFMQGGWAGFNLVSFGIAGITGMLLYACYYWWS